MQLPTKPFCNNLHFVLQLYAKWACKKQSRKLVGKLDDAGNIVPTSGRKGRLPKAQAPEHAGDARKEAEALKKETAELKRTIAALRRDNQELVKGLEDLLSKARR